MDKDGMVAVVRGTNNSGLCVTLLDGARQYTLLPNTVTPCQQTTNKASQAVGPNQYVVENSAQAVDGRYASVYQTVHCNMVPTSPTLDVSEFPPQRAALSKGHGNFEVGGLGSGETTYYPSRVKDSFRGGLTWPDRGLVFSPRPSVEPDRFASSLRKYPSLSAERSSEIVERLINYTQFRNSKPQRIQPLRSELPNRPRKTFEADIRTDESPTRERSRRYENIPMTDGNERSRKDDDRCGRYDEGDRSFDRSYDVRNVRYISRRCRDALRNVQISIDTQVEMPTMSSKEVATLPKTIPSVRNVAIPISPMSSIFDLPIADTKTSKSMQTLHDITLFPRKSVQTCFSSVDITNKKIKNGRKSKSQEELRDNEVEDEVLHLVQDITDPEERDLLRDNLVNNKNIYKVNINDRLKIKLDRCVTDKLFSDMDLKDFTRELSNQLVSKMKKHSLLHCNSTNLYRVETLSLRDKENCVDDVIEEWLRDIPIKNKDHSGNSLKNDNLLPTVANKLKSIVLNKLKLDSDKSFKTEIIQLIEDIPIAISGFEKTLYINRLATNFIRKIKEILTTCTHKLEKSNTDTKNNINEAIIFKGNTNKEIEVKYYVREELADFVRKFNLKICIESMRELEVEITDIVLDAIVTGKEDKIKEEILLTLFDLLTITEYQANYFANNMIIKIKKMFNGEPKIKSQTFLALNTQNRVKNTQGLIDEKYIKANIVWYTNQIIQKVKEWISSSIDNLDPNDNFTTAVIHELASDIVDRQKYLALNPTTKVSKAEEIEHLKYQIFKYINKLVGGDNYETIEKAPQLMEIIKNIPVPMLIKPQSTTQGYCQMCCDSYNIMPCSNSRQTNKTVDYEKGKVRSNITVAIGSVTRNKAQSSDSEESRIEPKKYNKGNSLPEQHNKPNIAGRMSDPRENRQSRRCSPKNGPCSNKTQKPVKQNTQEQIMEEFDQFLRDWVQRIPISEKPELVEKCRLGIYNGIWKAITKIKMNPESLDNPLFYKDVLDDEIEELLDCLTQTPELKKQRNSLKTEVLEKAAGISMYEAPNALNTSYRQQLVENVSNNLPNTVNRVDNTGQDPNKLYEEATKLNLAEYFILYTKYKEEDTIKANVYKRKLLKKVHELVNSIKQTHGKELREIEAKQYVESVIHALQKVPVPNDETINLETDEIILALEVEQWFSDLPLMPNEERMDVLARAKYRDMLAKKLFDLQNSNEADNEKQMKEEITKILKRMPFIPGQAENIPFMVEELIIRVKNRPRYDTDENNRNGVAFVEPHGYEAFSRDMPLCSSYTEDQNGNSYMIVGGERAADRSMTYGGQHVLGRNDPDSQQDWPSSGQNSAVPEAVNYSPKGAGICCGRPTCSHSTLLPDQSDPDSQKQWLTLEQTAIPEAMKGSLKGASPSCRQSIGTHSTSLPPQSKPNYQHESSQRSSSPEKTTRSPERAASQSNAGTSPSPLPQNWLPSQQDEQSKATSRTRRKSYTPQGSAGSCCRRASCPSQISAQSQTIPILDTAERAKVISRDDRQSPPNFKQISKEQPKTAKASKRHSPSVRVSKEDIVCKCPSIDTVFSGSSPNNFTRKSSSNGKVSRGQSPACKVCGQSSDEKLEPVKRKNWIKKSKKPPKVECECFKTLHYITSKRPRNTTNVSRGQSPISGSQSSDDKSVHITSKTRNKISKKPAEVEFECFKTPNNLTSKRPHTSTNYVSRGQSPISRSQSSDKISIPITSKTRNKKSKRPPKDECECVQTNPPAGNVSRGQSPYSSSESDEASRPVTSKTKPVRCNSSKSNRTAQTQSDFPVSSSRRATGYFPEQHSGRSFRCPADGISGLANMNRSKKRIRDIEQERREAARRRLSMDETDESDGDDLRCKCMERVWRWRRRGQRKPCDDNTDFMYPFPMMYPPPPCYF